MKILLLGQGGRESALAWKISQSECISNLYIAPGNAGTLLYGENVNLSVTDFENIRLFVIENHIDMVVVGPEDPLVCGIYDFFANDPILKNVSVIGPSKQGAMLEGSKKFAKQFMQEFSIPTAQYKSFTKDTLSGAIQFLETLKSPYVLKVDGLAAGKGVLIVDTLEEAKQELENIFSGAFGEAGDTVVIEEFLRGIECSVFVLTDEKGNYKILPVAKDYKRIGEADFGPNTGGMGAVSPVSFANDEFMQKVEKRIIKPTIEGIKKRKIIYKGFIFIGLIAVDNEPYVIEYNVRMGDPETEVVIPLVKSDIVDLFKSVSKNELDRFNLEVRSEYAVTVMLVAGGYPGKYNKGDLIQGLEDVKDSLIFQAGTVQAGNHVKTNGGRVLAITSFGKTKEEALKKSYANAERVEFKDKYYRKDIGFDLE